jgi:hypothetical protein
MGAPCQPPHGVLVSVHDGEWPAIRIANVKCSNQPVDSAGGDDCISVFIPVVGEDFGWWTAGGDGAGMTGRRMDGNGRGKVVFGG